MTDVDAPVLVRLDKCPPGLFLFGGILCFRSEYYTTMQSGFSQPDAYVVESGEYFHGGTSNEPERSALMVRPIDFDDVLLAFRPPA